MLSAMAKTTTKTRPATIINWGVCARAVEIDICDAASRAAIAALNERGLHRSAEPRIAQAKGHRIIAELLERGDYAGSTHIDLAPSGTWVVIIEAVREADLPNIERALRLAAAAVMPPPHVVG